MKTLSIVAILLTVIAVPAVIIHKKRWKPILLPIQRDENIRHDVDTMMTGESW